MTPFLAVLTLQVAPQPPPVSMVQVHPHNVLVILADDLGLESLALYGVGQNPPPTPRIDELAARGVRFEHVWSNPICSPTRATIQTGRYGFRTGIGGQVGEGTFALQPADAALPEVAELTALLPCATAAFGKWHLGNSVVGGLESPNVAGWDHFEGTKGNLPHQESYSHWNKITNGVVTVVDEYSTSHLVDRALAWIAAAPEPWLAYLAFHAPHAPYHAPPIELHTQDLSQAPPPEVDPVPYYRAMVEALDTEIGRLLDGITGELGHTSVIFLGDNGTSPEVAEPPIVPWKAKGTLFQGGIRVPMIVMSPLVTLPGSVCSSLVDTVDVFATAAELVGGEPALLLPVGSTLDGHSLVPYLTDPDHRPIQDFAYSEFFAPNGLGLPVTWERAIRGARYKLYQTARNGTLFFDLALDPWETVDLLAGPLTPEQAAAHQDLVAALAALSGS